MIGRRHISALLVLSSLGAVAPGCGGGSAGGGSTAEQSPGELVCSGRLPDECGLERSECESRYEELLPGCARAIAAGSGVEEMTQEQREIAVGLAMLCSIEVLRERRELEGRACTGDSALDDRYRSACLLCSLAAGTRRVASEPPEAAGDGATGDDDTEGEPSSQDAAEGDETSEIDTSTP